MTPTTVPAVIKTALPIFSAFIIGPVTCKFVGNAPMIANAKNEIGQDPVVWWNLLFASTMLFLLVLSVNIVGYDKVLLFIITSDAF